MIKYDVTFQKKGIMVYISHLDLMRLFRRAIRRARLPYVLTKGFTPRVKLSIPKALKLGTESDSENMGLWLIEKKPASEVKEAINAQLPDGIRITQILS